MSETVEQSSLNAEPGASEMTYRDPGEVPVIDWLDKSLVDVDPAYQRGLDEGRVQKILDWFAWNSFGAIVVAPAGEGRYHAIDGQHRLQAAKRHPKVSLLPAVIITGRGLVAEAETFVNVNAARKNVSPLELYWASLAAEDPEAVTVKQVTGRAGVKVLRYPGAGGKNGPGETVAIAALRSLIGTRGALRARQVLEVLANANLAPITAVQTEAIRNYAVGMDTEASAFAATHRLPKVKAFASVWFKRCRKKRKAG